MEGYFYNKKRNWISDALSDLIKPQDHPTDTGNSYRFVERYGHEVRFCTSGSWYIWNERQWEPDVTTTKIIQKAVELAQNLYNTATNSKEKAFATKSGNKAGIKNMIELAKSHPSIVITPDRWDTNPMQFNVLNGTIDLTNGTLYEHRRQDHITHLSPVEFDRDATCVEWKKFLKRIFNEDQDLIDYVQRVVGYSLTGDTREQITFILHGSGANGKSTFVNILRKLFGTYGKQAEFATFLPAKGGKIRNDLAMLAKSRFVAAVEVDDGNRLAEAVVKQLTGEDPITVRFLFKEYFEFIPRFKIFLVTNHLPTIRGNDEGIWRRLKVIPFHVTIPEKERDKTLQSKLEAELSGILTWALKGCLKWQESGLGEAKAVTEACANYRRDEDFIGRFIEEKCHVNPKAKIGATPLYFAFCEWCKENGEPIISQKSFGTRLKNYNGQPFTNMRGTNGPYYWHGLCLK